MFVRIRHCSVFIAALAAAASLNFHIAATQPPGPSALHARVQKRLIIKNAMVIYGSAKPPFGPVDIVTERGRISYIGTCRR